jgi:hypothetical protein
MRQGVSVHGPKDIDGTLVWKLWMWTPFQGEAMQVGRPPLCDSSFYELVTRIEIL